MPGPNAASLNYAQRSSSQIELRREDGATIITYQSGLPDPAQLKDVSNRALIRAAVTAAIVACLCAGIAYAFARDMVRPPRSLLCTAFIGAIAAGLVLFFGWQMLLNRDADTLHRALRQFTQFTIGKSALSISSDGPYGKIERTIAYTQITGMYTMTVYPEEDFANPSARTQRLEIDLAEKPALLCLPDRPLADYDVVIGETLFAAVLDRLGLLGCAWQFEFERHDVSTIPLSSCRLTCAQRREGDALAGISLWLAFDKGQLVIGLHNGWTYWLPSPWRVCDLLGDLFTGAYSPHVKTLTSLPRMLTARYEIERLNVR